MEQPSKNVERCFCDICRSGEQRIGTENNGNARKVNPNLLQGDTHKPTPRLPVSNLVSSEN